MSTINVNITGDFSFVQGSIVIADDAGVALHDFPSGKPDEVLSKILGIFESAKIVPAGGPPPTVVVPVQVSVPTINTADPAFQALPVAKQIEMLQKNEAERAAAELAAQQARGISYHVTK